MNLGKKLKNMRVRSKLTLYGTCMIIFMIILGTVAVTEAKRMDRDVKEITEVWSPSVACAQTMDTYTSDYRMKQYAHLVATKEEDLLKFEKELETIDNNINETRAEFEKKLTLDKEKELYSLIADEWESYVVQSEAVLKLSREGKVEEGGELMVGEMLDIFNSFQKAFDELIELEEKQLDIAKENVHQAYKTMVLSIILVVVIGAILSTWLSKIVTDLIAKPLQQITKASELMCQGDMSGGKLITYESRDELGIVANSLKTAMSILDQYIREISDTLREMAKGDLTKDGAEITEFLGDFETIKESFVYILKKFNSTLTDIQNTSEQVSVNSGQIADSSQALSNGAVQQADAIEEVTSTITKVVKLSEESAKETQEAYEHVKVSVNNAEDGRKKMEELTEEMQRIMDISKKIENISTTIEDIASQTNILSLNASVEAARAGEAGKGFAVVAEQIGKLASDSAHSAADTRELIGKTLEEIQKGSTITGETKEAFEQMIKDMREFAEAARKTTDNAKTEAESLEQVGQQIEMISGEIQNTAASSEENSAISENLSEEAVSLDQLVKRFKLF